MNYQEAHSIVVRHLWIPGNSSDHTRFVERWNWQIDSFMKKYPRGKGIKAFRKDLIELYEACKIVKTEMSRVKSYKNQ